MATKSLAGNGTVVLAAAQFASGKIAPLTTSSALVLNASDRKHLFLTNTGTSVIYIGLGTAAINGGGIVLPANQSMPLDVPFGGAIYALAATASGSSLAYAEF
jgi:hypothetical protein